MFSLETLKSIWKQDLALGYASPSVICTDSGPLPHQEQHILRGLDSIVKNEPDEKQKNNSQGANFAIHYDFKNRKIYFKPPENKKHNTGESPE